MRMRDLLPRTWGHERAPLGDAALDDWRQCAYWDWLEGRTFVDDAPTIATIPGGYRWVRLETVDHADFEASAMRHSIGYNWEHYSGMGEIYSLRAPGNAPEITLLLAEGTVVHARRAGNAAVGDDGMALIAEIAQASGWRVKPASEL